MNRTTVFCLACIASSFLAAAANVKFASPFSSNMVLQRDRDAPVWGTAEPNKAVTVTVRAEQKSGEQDVIRTVRTDETGRWLVKLPPHTASPKTSYSVTAQSGADSATLKNVLFGDVWICAGQSNMEMNYGWGLKNGKEDMEANTYTGIRLLNVPNRTAITPMKDFDASWQVCTPAAAKTFSACGYFFGTSLHTARPDVPVGLVDLTWSGTRIETWIPAGILATMSDDYRKAVESRQANVADWETHGRHDYAARFAAWQANPDPVGALRPAPFETTFDDSAWKTVELPKMMEAHIAADFDGVVWYRRRVTLTAAQAAKPAQLTFGPIDDSDITYVNGQEVARGAGWSTDRVYPLKASVLHAGENVIAVRIQDDHGDGGFNAKPEKLQLVLGNESIPLAGTWRWAATARPVDYGQVGPNDFGACYEGMTEGLFPLAVRGMIWYQGCSNVGNESLYAKMFPAMVTNLRRNLSGSDFPVYIVQLAAYQETHKEPFNSSWAAMRWTQTRLGESVKNCGTVSIIDKGEHYDIHPKDKKTVGERLARLARARTYGEKGLVECGPIPLAAAATAEGAKVTFKNAAGLKTADGAELKGFQIRTTDAKTFAWATAKIVGDTVLVDVPAGKTAAAVRYAWDDYPVCNLVNGADLPCGPFELDVR